MTIRNFSWACLLAVGALSACGSSYDDDVSSTAIPVGTTAEFSGYVGSRAADDTGEPVDIDTLMPPTSETAEPIDVT